MENNLCVDLHIHTTASDGCWSPTEVVEQLKQKDIKLFAVTDHDNIDHVQETADLARRQGLAFLSGVEISSKLNGQTLHILGYGFDLYNRLFADFVRDNEALLHRYDDFLVQQLVEAGYGIDLDEYERYSWDRHRGGWKALNFLIDLGLCRDVHSFFNELFVGPLEVSFPAFPPPKAVVSAIRQAGGVAVWAHPAHSFRKLPYQEQIEEEALVAQMVDAGIQGLECFTCHHDAEWTQRCLGWAERYHLSVTGGSDCHGGFAGRELGRPKVCLGDLHLGAIADHIWW